MLISSPEHSEKPPSSTSDTADMSALPTVASALLVSSRLTTKL